MLGLIVSGRLVRNLFEKKNKYWDYKFTSNFKVQTNFAQVGETQFLVDIEDADNINHVVLFLTGQVQLPAVTQRIFNI